MVRHGTIQMGLLDEIMGWTSYAFTKKNGSYVRIECQIFTTNLHAWRKIGVTCRVISTEGPRVNMQATLSNNDDAVCTTATGTFHILPTNKYRDLIQGEKIIRTR